MISVVIPAFNEEENVNHLYSELKAVLEKLQEDFEVIFVDDGSRDNTFDVLRKIADRDKRLKIIRFRKRYGQSTALLAGFRHAQGEIIVTLDADLQNDPTDIPELLKKMKSGFDMVCGWRKERKDPFFTKRMPSLIANWVASKVTGAQIHDFGCTLRSYRSGVVSDIDIYGEMHRYIPILAMNEGYSISEVEVKHRRRQHGRTKYNILRILRGLTDLLILTLERVEARPTYVFVGLGIMVLTISLVSLIVAVLYRSTIILGTPLWRSIFLISLMTTIGIQFLMVGVLSEMLLRIRYYLEGKRFYKISEIVNE